MAAYALLMAGACAGDATDPEAFCEAFEDLRGATPFGTDATATSDEMAQSFSDLQTKIAALVGPAPDETAVAARSYLNAVDDLIGLLEGVGFDPRLVDQLDYSEAVERYSEAAQRLQPAAEAACSTPS